MKFLKRKRNWLLAFVGSLFLIAGFCFYAWREPSYHGKTITTWLRQYRDGLNTAYQLRLLTEPQQLRFMGFLSDGSPDYSILEHRLLRQAFHDKQEAEAAVRAIGPDAVSYLRNLLDERESRLVRIRRILYQTFKVKELDPSERDNLARLGLGLIGPPAAPAVDALIQRLNQDPVLTCWALGQIGPAAESAVPALRSGLTNATTAVRRPCVYALAKIMANQQELVPILARQLNDPVTLLAAAYQLGQLGPRARDAVPALRLVGAGEALLAITADERHLKLGRLEQLLTSKLRRAAMRDTALMLMDGAQPGDYSATWSMPGVDGLEPGQQPKIYAVAAQGKNPPAYVVLWSTPAGKWGAVFTDPGAEYLDPAYEQWKFGDGVWSILEKR